METGFFLTRWLFLGMRWLYETILAGTGWQVSLVVVLTIVLSTLIIKALTVFGDIKSRKSSMKMQQIQPDLDKLRKKYGDDPKRLNVEQNKLMKEKGVSMFGGCLPMLFTLPLFFMFIAAFRAWSNEQTLHVLLMLEENPDAGLELFKSYKFLWLNNIWRPDNLTSPVMMTGEQFWTAFAAMKKGVPEIQNFVYYTENKQAIEDMLLRLGFYVQTSDGALTLASSNTAFITAYNQLIAPCIGVFEAGTTNGWAILPILAGGTSFLSSWVMMRNQPASAPSADGKPAPGTNKLLTYMMPVLTVVFCWQYDATFAIYWTVSNVIALGISLILNKKYGIQKQPATEVVNT